MVGKLVVIKSSGRKSVEGVKMKNLRWTLCARPLDIVVDDGGTLVSVSNVIEIERRGLPSS